MGLLSLTLVGTNKVREGFIVDEDEEIEERARRRRDKKRKHIREEEHLDEEDLELIGEHVPGLNGGGTAEVCACRRFHLVVMYYRDGALFTNAVI